MDNRATSRGLKSQVDFMYRGGGTQRFHGIRTLQTQSVADHTWHAVMLLWLIYGQDAPGVSIELIMAAMTHDAAEHKVGDLPAPAKRGLDSKLGLEDGVFRAKWGEMEQELLGMYGLDWEHLLSEEQLRQLKFVDSLEGAFFSLREMEMGNRTAHITECAKNFMDYVASLLTPVAAVVADESEYPPHVWNEHRMYEILNERFRSL